MIISAKNHFESRNIWCVYREFQFNFDEMWSVRRGIADNEKLWQRERERGQTNGHRLSNRNRQIHWINFGNCVTSIHKHIHSTVRLHRQFTSINSMATIPSDSIRKKLQDKGQILSWMMNVLRVKMPLAELNLSNCKWSFPIFAMNLLQYTEMIEWMGGWPWCVPCKHIHTLGHSAGRIFCTRARPELASVCMIPARPRDCRELGIVSGANLAIFSARCLAVTDKRTDSCYCLLVLTALPTLRSMAMPDS